ncbi:hypothetical protein D3C76_1831720 [compost metagenome]
MKDMMPKRPTVPAISIRRKRMSRIELAIASDGMTKFEIAVNETTMTMAADTSPA